MSQSVFFEIEFVALILFSLILPICIYAYMMWKKAISRKTVLLYGAILVAMSGVSIVLLKRLAAMASATLSSLDSQIFSSEIALALYLLPALFAGIGINVISHVLISHLSDAEKQFDRKRR